MVMGLAHKQLPYYGVQFHPESIATSMGAELVQNFHELCKAYQAQQGQQLRLQPTRQGPVHLPGTAAGITFSSAAWS